MNLIQSSHAGSILLYRRQLNAKTDIQTRLRHTIIYDVRGVLSRELNNVKFIVTVTCIFEKALRPGVYSDPPVFFKTSRIATTHPQPIESILQDMYEDVWEQINGYIHNGSGWISCEVLNVEMQVCQLV